MRLQKAHVLEVKMAFIMEYCGADSSACRRRPQKRGSQTLGRTKGGSGQSPMCLWTASDGYGACIFRVSR